MSAAAKETPTDLQMVLAELRKLRARVDDIADDRDIDYRDDDDSEPCHACAKRAAEDEVEKKHARKKVAQLAQAMCRDETSGDLSWLPFDERERWLSRAALALSFEYKPEEA